MTEFEIEYVKKQLIYFKNTYGISISHEDFIHDIDLASMVKDSSTASVNYQNVYKKYLSKVSYMAYKNNFSYSDITQDETSNKKTVDNILFFYEIMMVSILKSSIFGEYGSLPVAEVLFAGMNQDKYALEITPEVLFKNAIEEYKYKNPNLNYQNLCDALYIKMHDYKNVENKELSFKRISMLYTLIAIECQRTMNIAKKISLYKKLRYFIKFMSQSLDISKNELLKNIKEVSMTLGNYTSSVNSILQFYKTEKVFIFLRNEYEENEDKLMKDILSFKLKIETGERIENVASPFVNETMSEIKGGTKNA